MKHRRRQRREDLNDKHGSLDFGMGEMRRKGRGKKNKNGMPEMIVTDMGQEKMIHGKGLSLDLNTLGSPYVIASDLHGKASFDSASRSAHDDGDPYRPVRTASKSPGPPLARRPLHDSTKTEKQGLLGGAASPSSNTPRSASPVNSPFADKPEPAYNGVSVNRKPVENERVPPPLPPKPNDPKPASNFSIPRNIDRSSIAAQSIGESSRKSPPPPLPPTSPQHTSPPPETHDMPANGFDNYANYTDMLGISQGPQDPHGPQLNVTQTQHDPHGPPPAAVPRRRPVENQDNLGVPQYNDPRRLSGHLRPLPPEDPNDNAEQRANRIRSFYKEYFDDSKPAGGDDYYGYGDYYENYAGGDYFEGTPIWDDETGQWIYGGASGTITPPAPGAPRPRGPPGPRSRAMSQASRGRPVKKLPPPKPLNNLPTPHLLKDDTVSLPSMDFAPPPSMKERARGGSASPALSQRPYSPSVRAFTPLQSSFKELSVMPSPHALRKSGTFTGLDFAPPPRIFKGDGGGSDTSSIRSGRSGISAINAHNVRAGNYRLSRVGNSNVGTKDDLAATLKPKWDLGYR
ncbi:MAG: hypothetical protein Q9159_002272 [Coniocarpon cinnabarinum]